MQDSQTSQGSGQTTDLFLPVSGNTPFLLNNYDGVFIIQSGDVDVFSVRVHNGESEGPRNYLFSLSEGDALFGIRSQLLGQYYGILVVGKRGTTLLHLQEFLLHQMSESTDNHLKIINWVDGWITALSESVVRGIPPKTNIKFEYDQEIHLKPKEILYSPSKMFWIRPLEGYLYFTGQEELPPITPDHICPICPTTWLKAGDQCSVFGVDTQRLLFQGILWETIEASHELMLTYIVSNMGKSIQDEKNRLNQQERNTLHVIEETLSNVVSILNTDSNQAFTEESSEDPFFKACERIASFLGVQIEEPPSHKNKTLPDAEKLFNISKTSRFRTRRIILRDDWWNTDNGPLLAKMEEDNRPVALIPAGDKSYILYDEVNKVQYPVKDKVAAKIVPFAHMFYRSFPNEVLDVWKLLKFGRQGCMGDILTIGAVGTCSGILGMLVPIATGLIFDSVIPGAQRGQMVQLALALFASIFATALFGLTTSIAMLRLEAKMGNPMQAAVWDRLLNLPTSFFRKFSVGDLSQRSNGITAIQNTLTGAALASIMGSFFSLFSFGLLFYYDVTLALVALLLVTVMLSSTLLIGIYQVKYQRVLLNLSGKIAGMVLQYVTSIAKLRVAGAENFAFATWSKEYMKQKKIAFNVGHVSNAFSIFNGTFPIISSMTIFSMMSLTVENTISTGEFLAYNAAFGNFQSAMLSMASSVIAVIRIIPLYERAKPILDTLPEVSADKSSPGVLSGEIEVSHVSFRYNPTGPFTLRDISLQIKPGEFIAFVGPSGSGKSTLLRILLGFETAESGSVYYDDHDIATIDLQALRRQLGVVLQEGKLMQGDIFSNIAGASGATLENAMEAARMAGFDSDIKDMPMGIHTIVSEGGTTLSGGQRQRLLIARGLVHKPKILYFDEATSALDNQTQKLVTSNLEKLEVTRVVIAHRLSTIINADRIYVFTAGRVVQVGTYQELLEEEGVFSELVKRQML
ncbi:NHLP bacteriocin export ABC transporter permease/ATPase subunit [Deltaproteobacteria bacterium TL4]